MSRILFRSIQVGGKGLRTYMSEEAAEGTIKAISYGIYGVSMFVLCVGFTESRSSKMRTAERVAFWREQGLTRDEARERAGIRGY